MSTLTKSQNFIKEKEIMESLSIEEVCCILIAIQNQSMECQQGVFRALNKIIKEKKVRYYDELMVAIGKSHVNLLENDLCKSIKSLEEILTILEVK